MLIKLAVVVLLGAPPVAVMLFEVLPNTTALFNHGNVRLPLELDRALRWVLVTSDMHRIHHSVRRDAGLTRHGGIGCLVPIGTSHATDTPA